MKYKLYVLVDPNTRKIRYVGQTVQSVRARLNQHIWHTTSPSQRKLHVNYWIKQLLDAGQKPLLRLVCLRETVEEMDAAESAAIAKLRAKGYKLCNITFGGDGHFLMSEETKEKISQAQRGENNHFFGKKHTEETKELIRQAGLGRACSPETRAKLSTTFTGPSSPNWGRKHTSETRAKLLAAKAKLAKTWTFINPEGLEITFTNIKQFCRENGLCHGNMLSLIRGYTARPGGKRAAAISHRGWTYSKRTE